MVEFSKLCQTVGNLVNLSTQLDSNPKKERQGGVFRYIPGNGIRDGFRNSYSEPIGEETIDKLNLYGAISGEKAHRLFAHWLRSFKGGTFLDVFSSWQTRDFDGSMYGGAILINNDGTNKIRDEGRTCDILSFSGLYEPLDESVVTIAGLEHNLLDETQARRIVEFSGNPTYQELYDRFHSK